MNPLKMPYNRQLPNAHFQNPHATHEDCKKNDSLKFLGSKCPISLLLNAVLVQKKSPIVPFS